MKLFHLKLYIYYTYACVLSKHMMQITHILKTLFYIHH